MEASLKEALGMAAVIDLEDLTNLSRSVMVLRSGLVLIKEWTGVLNTHMCFRVKVKDKHLEIQKFP